MLSYIVIVLVFYFFYFFTYIICHIHLVSTRKGRCKCMFSVFAPSVFFICLSVWTKWTEREMARRITRSCYCRSDAFSYVTACSCSHKTRSPPLELRREKTLSELLLLSKQFNLYGHDSSTLQTDGRTWQYRAFHCPSARDVVGIGHRVVLSLTTETYTNR